MGGETKFNPILLLRDKGTLMTNRLRAKGKKTVKKAKGSLTKADLFLTKEFKLKKVIQKRIIIIY